jgi:IS5 family transposase
MAWKNLKQLSLADSLTSEHEALTELDGINELMDWEAIEHLLGDIHAKRRGNSAWPLCLCSRRYYCRAGIA